MMIHDTYIGADISRVTPVRRMPWGFVLGRIRTRIRIRIN